MNNIQVQVEKVNDVLVTTSNRVAEELSVEHKNLLSKIDDYVEKFGGLNFSHEFYIESTFENRGKQYRNYLITEKGVAQLIGGYSAAVPKAFELNVAYINEFDRMKSELNGAKIPTTMKEALLIALEQQEKIEALQLDNSVKDQQIAEMQPKASYYDMILQCKDLISVTEIAKDYGMSAKTFNKRLHELGIQYKQSGIWFLYAKYQSRGYTKTKTQNYSKPDGTQGAKTHMYWTQVGRLFLYDLLKHNNILPMIEREDMEDFEDIAI